MCMSRKQLSLCVSVAAIGMLGFPVTAAFIGIDVLFTYVHSDQVALIILMALCFIFIELAQSAFCCDFFGLHKKLYHQLRSGHHKLD